MEGLLDVDELSLDEERIEQLVRDEAGQGTIEAEVRTESEQ